MKYKIKNLSAENFSLTCNFLMWLNLNGKTNDAKYVKSFGFLLGNEAFKAFMDENDEVSVLSFAKQIEATIKYARLFTKKEKADLTFVGIFDENDQLLLASHFFINVLPILENEDNSELKHALVTGYFEGICFMCSCYQCNNTIEELFG